MEEIAFSDWPGQPVDLSGSNPWLPAYGFQPPQHALLEKEDFVGNPDADLFLQTTAQYAYLETIQEETSDDLRSSEDEVEDEDEDEDDASDSDVSSGSQAGWLATDSESGSVIRIHAPEGDESDREVACPAKRRRQEPGVLLALPTLNLHVVNPYSDDDSVHSLSRSSSLLQFESLEKQCQDVSSSSPSVFSSFSYDSLERRGGTGTCEFNNLAVSPDSLERDEEAESDYYRCLKIDVASSGFKSEETLKTWRSFDNLKGKTSTENLSEDSGYSDHFRSSSIPNMVVVQHEKIYQDKNIYKTRVQIGGGGQKRFDAYDGEISGGFNGNFGVSYHDLCAAVDHEQRHHRSPLIARFMRNSNAAAAAAKKKLNLERTNFSATSVPNLLDDDDDDDIGTNQSVDNKLGENVRLSVPKDLNLAGEIVDSVAAKNYDLTDLIMPKVSRYHRAEYGDKITIRLKYDTSSIDSSDVETGPGGGFKREGSYLEAMEHTVDMSDEERKVKKEFDRLKAISEHSVEKLDFIASTPLKLSSYGRNVASTPNLHEISTPRKSSLINRSTSTSGVSEDETLASKSFSGSTASRVHFSPVISEVNWRDDSVSTERESSTVSSTPERDVQLPMKRHSELSRNSSDSSSLDGGESTLKSSTPTQFGHVGLSNKPEERPAREHRQKQVKQLKQQQQLEQQQNKPVVMEVTPAPAPAPVPAPRSRSFTEPKKSSSGKLGGFFSRLASFRFSARNKPEKKQEKQKATPAAVTQQRQATKNDYIYIPLKDPEETTVSSKPPLPKMPPRVIGASVKKSNSGAAATATARSNSGNSAASCGNTRHSNEHRTIDSGRPRPMEPMGLIETDLDTEVTVITNSTAGGGHAKTRSLMNLGGGVDDAPHVIHRDNETKHLHRDCLQAPVPGRPHKSMEFLLDKQNLKVVEPPENELQKGGERVMSEHQLRVQRSLQKLNVPEWYKHAAVPREGFLLKKTAGASRESRWQGTGSKTTSLNSLGSTGQSPVALSPTTLQTQPFVRWSTSKLNSTASSPCASTRSSFNARQPNGPASPSSLRGSFSYRQPYMGWRSQERLARPRTPAERLANSILTQSPPAANPEIQTSIKEVTSAIVHYVSALRPDSSAREHSYDSQETASQRSRSVSPRGSNQKLCWVESSFVGTRPLDSPQTPVTLAADSRSSSVTVAPPNTLRLDLNNHNDTLSTGGSKRPSPSSTTLEDVLDSLLGLPSSTRAPSPSLQETASASTSPVRHQGEQFRRRSEGSEPTSRPPSVLAAHHRASFHSSPILRCRYSRCGRSVIAKSAEAATFKNCHNCSYTYCSRTCRRAHWEKHRRTCLFSRVGTLCRQVIAAAKEQEDTLHTLSVIARRGFLSHGPGAVKIFFPRPEAAEKFLSQGLVSLGDPTYVRWPDLLPSEMGPQLYAELVRMCKSYNPDGKLVLYVSVCVVSEAPAAGAVKWERQLVSRCGKMRLSKNVPIPDRDTDNPETLVFTSPPIKEEKLREASFNNIQRHLRQRGVSLKRHYPKIYQQMCNYVEGTSTKFTPVTVYPKDSVTGKTFMCIIMPDAEPDCIQKVTTAGVRVRTVNVLLDDLELDQT